MRRGIRRGGGGIIAGSGDCWYDVLSKDLGMGIGVGNGRGDTKDYMNIEPEVLIAYLL